MVVQYKCPGCGADLRFDSKSGRLKCDSCGREMNVDDMEFDEDFDDDYAESNAEDKEELPKLEPFAADLIEDEEDFESIASERGTGTFSDEDGKQYFCKNCGAVIVTTDDTTATSCSFCGAPVVIGERLSGELAPAKVIPFKISKEEAMAGFRKWCKNGLLLPTEFKKAERVKSVTGMYVPFWLYDMAGTGEADCTATKVRTYSRGDYIYTETKYYHVYRRVHLAYNKVPADASEKMNDELMDKLEPFDYSSLSEFKMPYLAGYLAEKYNYDEKQLLPRIRERVNRYAESYLSSTIGGYTTVHYNRKNINMNMVNAHYTLLPVWMVCYDYKDSEHMFVMNGQTGKIVGKPPLSKNKMAAWYLGISAGVFALLRLLTVLL